MTADEADGPAERATIARRASRGFVASLVRVGLNQIAAGAALIIFARRLDGAQFALFTAFGLGAPLAYRLLTAPLSWVLIRQKAQPSGALVTSVVAVVEVAVLTVGAVVLAVGAALGAWPLRVGLAAVVYVIALPLCLPALVGLYRAVDVSRAAALEAVDRVAFYTLAAAGVLAGMGTDALVLAFLGTAGAMLVTAQLLRPWRPARPAPRSAVPLLRQAFPPAPRSRWRLSAISPWCRSWPCSQVGTRRSLELGVLRGLPRPARSRRCRDERVVRGLRALARGGAGIGCGGSNPARHGRRRRRRRAGRGSRARGRDRRLPAPLARGLPRPLDGRRAAGALAAGAALSMLWNARLSTVQFACWQAIVLGAGYAAALAAVPLFGAAGFAGAYLGAQVVLTAVLVRAAQRRLAIALAWPVLRILGACGSRACAVSCSSAHSVPACGRWSRRQRWSWRLRPACCGRSNAGR